MTIDRQRFKIYIWIGVCYLTLHLIAELVQNPETFYPRFFNNIWLVLYLIPINYIMFDHALPFIKLEWRRILIAPFLLFGMLMLYSFGFFAWRQIGIAVNFYTSLKDQPDFLKGVEYHVSYSIPSIFFFGVLKYTYDFRMLKEAAQRLRIEKQNAELNYLKSQTNPHFLFNTLNNIYALSRDKSDLAPESIMRLSKILRFMLYETGGDYIAVEQEVKIMHDYIELEKLRYDSSLHVNFNHDIEDMKQAVPPLLLIPLVENAFKHGVSETRSQPFVDIHLSVRNRKITFIVKNSADLMEGTGVKENIGLSNLRRQLELLYTDYNLSLQHNGNVFIATLKINLASHV
jgi:hypothetical protein